MSMIISSVKKFYSSVSGTHFGDVLKGSSVNSLAKVLATALGFGGSLLIGHFYNAEVIGRIATMSSIFTVMTLFVLLGNQTYILRTVPTLLAESGAKAAYRSFLKVVELIGLAGILVIILAAVFLPKATNLYNSIGQYQLLLFALVFATAIKKISLRAIRAVGDYKIFSAFEVLPALLMILAVIISVALSLGDEVFIYVYYAPHFILAILAFFLVWQNFDRKKSDNSGQFTKPITGNTLAEVPTYAQILSVSTPMLGVALSNAAIAHTDILMLGTFTNEETVGIFSIYVKITALMSLGILATNSMFAPKASRLFDAKKIEELGKLTRQTTSFIFLIALVSFIGILIIHRFLLSLYGQEFFGHLAAFYILLIALLANSIFGAVGMLLNMTGQQNYFLKIIVSAAIMNAVANYFLIPIYGPTGAAISTLMTTLYWNSMAVLRVRKLYGFVTFPTLSFRS